jgi:hypothetical protein
MADALLEVGTIQGGFSVFDGANQPITGLVQADFEILLAKDGIDSAVAVTISEVGQGRYHYEFEADAAADWFLLIRGLDESPRGWSEDVLATTIRTGQGSGGAPKKYWHGRRREMRNGFMLDGAVDAAVRRVDDEERAKIVSMLAMMSEEY